MTASDTDESDTKQVPVDMPLRLDRETQNLVNTQGVALARFRHRSQGEAVARLCNSHSALVAENERLKGALKQYGQHDNDCSRWVHDEFDIYAGAAYDETQPCSCGFEAALTPKAST